MQTESSSFWRNRRVFVTGAAGLLGTYLCKMLVERGADVVGLVRDRTAFAPLQNAGIAEKMTLVFGDIRDQALMERVFNNYEIQTVFHLAAQAIVGAANRNPVETFDSNIKGTWTVLEAARRTPLAPQVLVASSDKAYGQHEILPYTEDAPLQGRHPYDVSKSCADLIAQSYAHTYQMPIAIARCGNLFGGGDLHWNRLVPGTVRAILENTPPLIRSDGTLTRDYLFVEDGASAYLSLSENLARDENLRGQAFNFGNNAPLSVLEMVQKITQVSQREDLQPRILNEANHEIPAQYLDCSRAADVLNWHPQFSLEVGLKKTLEWYRNYLSEAEKPRA